MSFRPPSQRLRIRGPAGDLDTVLEEPPVERILRFGVVCHPHSQQGGTLDNKVVHTIARTLQQLGLPTLRFNFRGVGQSAGVFDEGVGETDDALAVVEFGRNRWPGAALWLAGFSFGAFVALRASERRTPERLITVAPPVQRFQFGALKAPPDCPWLIVQGDQDDIVDCAAVVAWARQLSPPPHLVILPGVGHFFHGRLQDLKDTILQHVNALAASAAKP